MKKNTAVLIVLSIILSFSSYAQAVTFTPDFTTPTFPGSQFTVDSTHNDYYSANFGITVENAYLYVDSRDTFDGIGIANGTVDEIGTLQSGRINFLDTTNFVTVDYLAILDTAYEAFSSTGTLISVFNGAPGVGTFTLTGGVISYMTFTTTGGYGTVSGLTYNYDGTTDGRNTDLNSVPEPTSLLLLGAGLTGLGIVRRKVGLG